MGTLPDPESSHRPSLLARVTQALCSLPHRRPRTLVVIAALVAAVGGWVYAFELEVYSGREPLSNLERPLNRRVERYEREFGVEPTVLVLITAGAPEEALRSEPPGPETRWRMKQAARHLAATLRSRPDLFPEVVERLPTDEMGPLALLYLRGRTFDDVVAALRSGLPELAGWAREPTIRHLFEIVASRLDALGGDAAERQRRPAMAAGLAAAERFLEWFRRGLADAGGPGPLGEALAARLGAGEFDAEGHLFVAGGRLLIVPATVRGDPGRPNEYDRVVEFARAAIRAALAATDGGGAPVLHAGLAGLPAMEYDEMASSRADFTRGAAIALVLVSLLFMAAFTSFVHPALSAVCLGMSIGSTFVYAWVAVGHLNLMALVFTIILVALGVDFAIHFATHYERARGAGIDSAGAVSGTLRRIGGALWMGGVTTAATFLCAGFTEAPGLSELGIIAGGGLVLCLTIMFFVYPAMIYLADRRRGSGSGGSTRGSLRPLPDLPHVRTGPVLRLLCVAIAGLAVAGYIAGQYRFDTNLLSLHPTSGAAARWQRVLLGAEDRTRFAIATFDEREALERAREELLSHPEIVRSTDSAVPVDEERKRRALAPLCDRVQKIVFDRTGQQQPERLGVLRALFAVRQSVRRLRVTGAEAEAALAELDERIDGAYRTLAQLDAATAAPRLAGMEEELLATARAARERLGSLCCPPEFRLDLVPEPLRDRFIGRSGQLALFVYPSVNTWDREELDRFVSKALEIEPDLFGGVVNFHDNAGVMVQSIADASLYALIAVVVLVLAWCRSPVQTLLSLFPLAVSMGLLLGLMRISPWPLPWNFANFFAVPILIGIGVDSGIHLTRGWKEAETVFQGARRAVLVSTLTTLIGFAVLGTSQHLGIRSLGIVLTLGIASVLVSAVVLLPVVLRALAPWQRQK